MTIRKELTPKIRGRLFWNRLIWLGAIGMGSLALTGLCRGEGFSQNQARLMVKRIPSVDVAATLARWKFDQDQLQQLRHWSQRLAERPDCRQFLPDWRGLIEKRRSRNRALDRSAVTSLIQMILKASYQNAGQKVEVLQGRMDFLEGVEETAAGHLARGRQLRGALGTQSNDPLSASRLPLPASDRTLQRCQIPAGEPDRLHCEEILVYTRTDLDSYLNQTSKLVESAGAEVSRVREMLSRAHRKRRLWLEALSTTAKLMGDAAGL